MMNKLLYVSIASVLSLGIGMTVMAAGHKESESEAAMEYRQAVMEVIAWNFKSMVAMVKGNAPFDAATFAMRAENVAALTRNSMPLEGFIPNTHNGDTEAKAEIWKNWDDFKSKMSTLEKEAASLAEVAKTATQLKDVGPQFKKTGEACKGCHEKYKKD